VIGAPTRSRPRSRARLRVRASDGSWIEDLASGSEAEAEGEAGVVPWSYPG